MGKLTTPVITLLGLVAAAAHAAGPSSSSSPNPIPALADFTLGNGLRVIVAPQPSAPAVAVQVFYHAGSKDEPEARRGIAHLFEHMMFKGTARVPPEAYARYINRLGGDNNAFTTDDLTAYVSVVPPAALDFVLALEADRMRGLALTQGVLDSEREVVKEELRARIENNPVMQGVQRILALAYTKHPYRVMSIGQKEMLDSITVADCRRFYDLYYQPENATLVVVGATSEAEVRALAEARFGALARGPAIVRNAALEPPQTSPRQAELTLPMALPVVLGAYHVPGASHADMPVLEVLQEILSGGESSRLYRRIVQGGLGVFAGGFLFDYEAPGLFVTFAQLAPDGDPRKVQAAFDEELARVTTQRVTPAELKKARNKIAGRAVFEREHIQGLATTIGSAALLRGDPLAPFHDLARYETVTADEVLAVAKKYLVPDNRSSLALKPGRGAPLQLPRATRPSAGASTAPAAKQPPLLPPHDLPVPKLALGEVVREMLPNGLHVLVVPRHELPLVRVQLVVAAGNLDAPIDRIGLAELTAEMLRKGAGGRTAAQLAELVDGAGTSLGVQVDDEQALLSCSGRSADLPLCLELVADLATRPAFPAGELAETRVELAAQQVQDVRDNPEALALIHAANAYFGDDDPRGRSISERSLDAIARKDLVAFHAARYRPDAAQLVVSGDVDVARLKALLARPNALARWKKRGPLPLVARPLPAPRPPHLRLVDRPDATQTTFLLLGPGVAHRDADVLALEYANYILGGGDFSSRLMQVVRADGGKTYGVFSSFEKSREPGAFLVGTSTRVPESGHTLKLVLGEIDKMRQRGPTAAELDEARGHLVGNLAVTLESANDVALALARAQRDGLADDYVEKLPAALAAVTLDEVKRAAAAHLSPEALVAVGPAAAVRPLLEAIGLVATETLPFDVPVSAADRAAKK